MTIKEAIKEVRSRIVFRGFASSGKNSYMQKPLRLTNKNRIIVGDNTFIRKGIRLEVITDWFGETFDGSICIGDNVVIEQNCHFVSAKKLEIGNDCLISANVFITDCAHQYFDVNQRVLLQPLSAERTTIGSGTFIGYGACIMEGVNLGKHCVVGANSVVTKSFPDYSVIVGVPAVLKKRYNTCSELWEKCNTIKL